ncbi:MAG: hypothetical protein QHG99_09125 [Methanomicrobiales archaeon]|nr:hypothetical protein [Methanomicrobiales archaeon]
MEVSTDGELYGEWPGWCLDNGLPTGCGEFNVVPYTESTRPADWDKMNDLLNADTHWTWNQKNKYVFANAVATFMHVTLPFTPMDQTELERYNHIMETKTGYEPECGGEDCYTVVLEPMSGTQPVVICVPTPPCEIPSPEFPTIAVPVGMLLGLLAVIVYSRR